MSETAIKKSGQNDATRRRKAIFGAILLASTFVAVGEISNNGAFWRELFGAKTAVAAPPSRRPKNRENAQNREQPKTRENAQDAESVRNAFPARRGRGRVAEQNDGGLPAAGAIGSFFDAAEEANLAERWSDPNGAAELREKVLDAARERRETWPKFREIDANAAKKLGIRRIEGENVVLWTDLPKSSDVDEIPNALSAALPLLATFFELDENRFKNWKIDAFLIGDYQKFVKIGALNGPPVFLHGYSSYSRIFALDKKVGYYNRFLLLHELIHTVMHETFGDLRPRWLSEGFAEYLALHRWNATTKSIQIAQIPESADATPGFGRLRQIQELVRDGKAPSLRTILNFAPKDYVDVSTYAWSWAFVTFLNNSSKYREIVREAPYWATVDDPNRVFCDLIGDRWGELEADWADFIEKIDYRYDFDATEIDATPGRPFAQVAQNNVARVEVAANRGWQNSGIALDAGETVRLAATGRFDFFVPELKKTLEFEATGATFSYYFGVPAGRLQAVVVPNGEKATFDEFYSNKNRDFALKNGFSDVWRDVVSLSGSTATLTAERAGTLYLRLNAAPGNLAKNKGGVEAQIRRVERQTD